MESMPKDWIEGVPVILLHLMWVDLPLLAYWWTRQQPPHWRGLFTGAALGLVIAPVSLGLYLTAWLLGPIPPLATLVGMPAFFLRQIHGWPSQWLIQLLELPPLDVFSLRYWALEILNGLVWAPVYGALGYGLMGWRRARRHEA